MVYQGHQAAAPSIQGQQFDIFNEVCHFFISLLLHVQGATRTQRHDGGDTGVRVCVPLCPGGFWAFKVTRE
jgi:hypothetical protein